MAITVRSTDTNVYVETGITPAQIGLGNVDNTSDANKPISNATQAALDAIAGSVGDVTYRQEAEPLTGLADGDTWYQFVAHKYYVRRNSVWEELVYKNELDGAFGSVLMNGGNF